MDAVDAGGTPGIRGLGGRTRAVLYAAIATVVLALIGATVTFAVTPTSWRSRLTVVVVPAQTDGGATGTNPLLRPDSRTAELAALLATAVTSADARTYLHRQGGVGTFKAAAGHAGRPRSEVRFTVHTHSPASATRTAAALESVARDQLVALQTRSDIPGAAQATLVVVLGPTTPIASHSTRWWASITTAAIVLLLGALAWLVLIRAGSEAGSAAGPAPRAVAPPRPRTRRQRRHADEGGAQPRSR